MSKWIPFIFENDSKDPEVITKVPAWELLSGTMIICSVRRKFERKIHANIKRYAPDVYVFNRQITGIVDIRAICTRLADLGLEESKDYRYVNNMGTITLDFRIAPGNSAQFEFYFSDYIED
jgi:hypothetical protein